MHEPQTEADEEERFAVDADASLNQHAGLAPALRRTATMQDLPGSAHDLIEVIGLQATIDLVGMFGGTEFKVPARCGGASRYWTELEESLGTEAARKLVTSRFGGTPIYVPMCTAALRYERNRQIVELIRAGMSVERAGRKFRLTKSAVYRIYRRSMAA